MKITFTFIVTILFPFMLLAMGCQQEEAKKENTGVVEATEAYLNSFGVPPQGKAGRAYATVGYLPVKGIPEKVGPIPIFLFTEENQLEKVLDRLVSGELITSDKQLYYHPFPSDLKILAKPIREKVLTLDLITAEDWKTDDQRAGTNALTQTALQFKDVQFVKVMLNGTPMTDMPEKGYQLNRNVMIDIPPPTLILMAVVWEKEQEPLEEILVEFDRPIKVNNFSLFHLDGNKVEGEYYTSIFQMAVVVHPKLPELFQEGTSLRAEWNVVDDLGRTNSGVDTMQVKKFVH